MKKTIAWIIIGAATIIFWGYITRKCIAGPGAPEAPSHSQIGKRNSFDPRGLVLGLRKIKHICLFPNREIAETNSYNETTHISIANSGNTKEYSELWKIDLCYNYYYVKCQLRKHRLYGLLTCVSCGDEGAMSAFYLCPKQRYFSIIGTDSQFGTSEIAELRNFCATGSVHADKRSFV